MGLKNTSISNEKAVMSLDPKVPSDGSMAIWLDQNCFTYCYQSYYSGRIQYGKVGTKSDFSSISNLDQRISMFDDNSILKNLIAPIGQNTLCLFLESSWSAEQNLVLLSNWNGLNPKFSPHQLLRIKEFEGIDFIFPNLVLCKGTWEFINVNLNDSTINYFSINSPLFVKSSPC